MKNLWTITLIPFLCFGCSKDEAELVKSIDRHQVAREYTENLGFDALDSFDPEPWLNTLAEDIVMNDPYCNPNIPIREGKEQVRNFALAFANQFENNRFTADEIFVAGEYAAIKYTWSGVLNDGSGTPFENQGIDIIHIDDHGLIRTLEGYWESPQLGQQNDLIRQTGENFFKSLNTTDMARYDVETWLVNLSDDVSSLDPVGGDRLQGKSALKTSAEKFATGMGSIEFIIHNQFVSSTRTAIHWTANATTRDGSPLTWSGIDVLEVEEQSGLITKIFGYWDNSIFQ